MSKVIIVTGGAKGIGRGIVERLASEDNNVILNYRNSKIDAEQIQSELKNKNINIDIYHADVSNEEEVKEFVKYVIDKYGKIDILINNAGIDQIKTLLDITIQDWNEMIKNNLTSAFLMTKEVAKHMISRKEGSIINISSIWGITGASCESHYAVTKAGMDSLTKSLAKELGPSNITVNSIAPGIIDTDMNKNLTSDEKKEIIQEIPLERIGTVEDVVIAVQMLIESKYITGQIIQVNGGWKI